MTREGQLPSQAGAFARARRAFGRHPLVVGALARPVAAWLARCERSGDWRVEGREALLTQLADGPVILAMWHEHILMAVVHWPPDQPNITVHGEAPIARVAGRIQASFGSTPVPMATGLGASRTVMRGLRDGKTAGLAVDGPRGPRHTVNDAAIDWARASGVPLWTFAWSALRARRLGSWDRMLFPVPRDKGVAIFRASGLEIPRRLDAERRADLRVDLARALHETAARAAEMAGTEP